jgi:hypothetical protein
VGKERLSRELGPTEVPEDANESLPLAATGPRRTPYSGSLSGGESLARGSEDRAGVETEDPAPPREGARVPEDPPRGRRSSGEH